MFDIFAVLLNLRKTLDRKTLNQLSIIVEAILSMTGRVTMLGISRWTNSGGSYRTIQRFFKTNIPWFHIQWNLVSLYFFKRNEDVILTGDEVVVTKSGKKTHGLNRFFSSLYSRVIPGISFLALAVISVKHRKSYTLITEQIVRSPEKKSAKTHKRNTCKQRGRPKGSRNKNKQDVELSKFLLFTQKNIFKILETTKQSVNIKYFVYDGAFGNNKSLKMVRETGLHLISKLRNNSALYYLPDEKYKGIGRPKIYGDKIDFLDISKKYICKTSFKKGVETIIYQMHARHKNFPKKLNVVIIVKKNVYTKKAAHVVLFSSDLNLPFAQLIDYYSLRFQIEFNFRDAKQFWGLEDFMNIKQTQIYNAANLSMFMVNLSQILIQPFIESCPKFNVNDLKSLYRGRKYVKETLKILPKNLIQIVISNMAQDIFEIGRINFSNSTC